MSDLRKAAEQYIRPGIVVDVDVKTTAILVDLLRQALSQPPCQTGSQCIGNKCPECEWVGLTKDEIEEIADWSDNNAAPWYLEYARAIEAKLKEKNT